MLVPQACARPVQLAPQVGEIPAAPVLELHPLEIVPNALRRVQVRRIAGQSLQMQPFGRPCRQVLFDGLPLMDGRAIPNDQDFPADLAKQLA